MPAFTVYIAGPMTGLPDYNFPAFNRAAKYMRSIGLRVVNPAELHSHTDRSWEFYMRSALTAMLKCQGVYMLKDWQGSKGACIELELARKLGFVVIFEADQS